jgi:nitrogen regulatory protein PII
MKKIEATIKPHELDTVRDALTKAGVVAMTVSEVRGFGRHTGHTEMYRGAAYAVESCPQLKLEIAVPDAALDQIVSLVCGVARTSDNGDGKVFVSSLDDVVRVRTGEHGERAL